MTTIAPILPAPIKKTIEVTASVDLAFRIFTGDMTSWWELESHHIGKVKAVEAIMEPRAGGRWYERGEDGSECDWGRVLSWDPPHRVLLTWQIGADWQFDPKLHTEVEVRFVEAGNGVTRVELEHRMLDAYGEKAAEMRTIFDSEGGWPRVLEQFARRANELAAS